MSEPLFRFIGIVRSPNEDARLQLVRIKSGRVEEVVLPPVSLKKLAVEAVKAL